MKKRCHFRFLLFVAVMLVSLTTLEIRAVSTQAKPNLVIILADDLGYGDVSCYGSAIETPNLDQLAEEGMKFTDFHSNGVNCSPTRCALLTGRYQHRAGMASLAGPNDYMKSEELTFAEVLKTSGYATAIYGKWHVGDKPETNPVNQGFDEFRGHLSGRIDYFSHFAPGIKKLDWWDGLEPLEEEGYSTTLITDHSIDFIR